jgi:hypothetical protein
MRNPTWLGTVLLAGALAGCGNTNNTNNSTSYHGSPTPWAGGGQPPAATTLYGILPGASTIVSPGTQAGYGISANDGASYRLVWTGDAATTNALHEFWGSIWTAGHFTSTTPGCAGGICALESGDYVGSPVADGSGGQRVDFDTFAADGLDGLDFVVDNEPVYFDFYIDGMHYPDYVFFPAKDTQPPGQISSVAVIPFALTTQ